MNYALALAGGGTRGAAHVGVLKALEEEDLLPTAIGGTSAGSIAAGLYAAGVSIADMEKLVGQLSVYGTLYLDPDYFSLIKFIPQILFGSPVSLTGFFKGNKLMELLCRLIDKTEIQNLPIKTVIPAVDLKTGYTIAFTNAGTTSFREHVVWQNRGRLCEIIMASCSVPSVFCPRQIESFCLVDGGVTNNLPVNLLMAAGETRIIAVDLGVDYKTPHEHSIIEIISHSFSIMRRDLQDCMSTGEILLLNPPLKTGSGLLTFEHMMDCMEDGYRYTKKMIPRIRKSLASS